MILDKEEYTLAQIAYLAKVSKSKVRNDYASGIIKATFKIIFKENECASAGRYRKLRAKQRALFVKAADVLKYIDYINTLNN